MPKKGDFIKNPQTGRPIKVGGRVFNRLVREGIIDGEYEDENELYDISDDYGDEAIEDKKKELSEKLPKTKHAVRGRGRYKSKLVVRNHKLTRKKKKTINISSADRIMANLEAGAYDDETAAQLQQLIDAGQLEAALGACFAEEESEEGEDEDEWDDDSSDEVDEWEDDESSDVDEWDDC